MTKVGDYRLRAVGYFFLTIALEDYKCPRRCHNTSTTGHCRYKSEHKSTKLVHLAPFQTPETTYEPILRTTRRVMCFHASSIHGIYASYTKLRIIVLSWEVPTNIRDERQDS